MGLSWLESLIGSGLRMSLPLIFAAFGGMLSERSGVANIALEGFLLAGSFTSAATMAMTHSAFLSVTAGVVGTLLVGLVFSFFTVFARADQIITGMAINLLITGLIPVLSKGLFDVSGQTPTLSSSDRLSEMPFFFLAPLVVVLCSFVFSKTKLGLRALASGENPDALRTQGVSVEKTRLQSILLGSAIASFGGIYLSIAAGSGYTREMSAGRGYIALGALIFGGWKPLPTLIGCLIFGLADSLQIQLQSVPVFSNGDALPVQVVQALPYVLTVILLSGFAGKIRAPAAINRQI